MPLLELRNSRSARNKQNSYQISGQNNDELFTDKTNVKLFSPSKHHNDSLTNQLKIKLADKQFELKKLQQDYSIKITGIMKELNKQKNEKKQIIKQSKQKIQQQTIYCNRKITQLTQQYQNQLIQKDNQLENKVNLQVALEKQKIIQKYQRQIQQIKIHNELQKATQQTNLSKIVSDYEIKLKRLEQKHTQQTISIINCHNTQIQAIKSTYLKEVTFCRQLDQSKSKQNKVFQRILSDKLKNVEQQLTQKRNQTHSLTNTINQKDQQIDELRKEMDIMRIDIICWERKFSRLQPDLKSQFQQQVKQMKTQYQTKSIKQSQRYAQLKSSIQHAHLKCIKSYQIQVKTLEERSKNLLQIFKSSKSKQQDLKRIQMLEMNLIKKQFQIEKERQDLKKCKLQLGNMDQLFQKMFQQAKLKTVKHKKVKLPSLLSSYNNRSIVEQICVAKKQKKFSVRDHSHKSMSKHTKDLRSQMSIAYD